MTRAEVERVALQLPDGERADLVGTLLGSLNEAGLAALRSRLATTEEAELEALASRLEGRILEWFQGSGVEWADEDWTALERGEYRHTQDRDSLAVPPGWRPPQTDQDA